MPKRITWKKGMRLTPDVFTTHDMLGMEAMRLHALASGGGRMGLFFMGRPFELDVNVTGNLMEIVTLRCAGLTKKGVLVDINFDSNYNTGFDTHVAVPAEEGLESLLLVVRIMDGEWREVDGTYSEPSFVFSLIDENGVIDDNSLPIGRIVNQYGWRLDETDFIPPCLYVDAHYKYVELVSKAMDVLKGIRDKCLGASECVARQFISAVWRAAWNACIEIDSLRGALTPELFLAEMKKTVASFVSGSTLDPVITLDNATPYIDYSLSGLNPRTVYADIERGLRLCVEISLKLDAVLEAREEMATEQPRPEPKPKTSSRRQPDEDEMRRRRWSGIEV